MQIVIDIPEIFYEALRKTNAMISGQRSGKTLMSVIYNAVANGTPLPKGHGRLIDADELKKHKYHDGNRHEKAVSVAQIDWQPTIIEADTESEGKE